MHHVRIATLVALAGLAAAPGALADTTAQTLTVGGQGSVMVKPDIASLSLAVTRFAPTSAPALKATNRVVGTVVNAVEQAGVPASEIQTDSVDTRCGRVRVGPKGHQRSIRRCTATQSISITSPASIVGHVIDAANGAGADDISGPDFSFSDPSAGEIAAEKAALLDARHQADAAATQLGCVVTGVASVDLNPGSDGSVGTTREAAPTTSGAASSPTRVHAGRQEVDATVAVVFTIAAAGS